MIVKPSLLEGSAEDYPFWTSPQFTGFAMPITGQGRQYVYASVCHSTSVFFAFERPIIDIKGTSEGDILDFEFIKDKQDNQKNKKFSNKDVKYAKEYHTKYKDILTKQKILDKLLDDKNIKIGIQTFNKIIKGDY